MMVIIIYLKSKIFAVCSSSLVCSLPLFFQIDKYLKFIFFWTHGKQPIWEKTEYVQCSHLVFNTVCTIQCNTIQYNAIQYNTIQYNTIQYNTIQYNTIQYNTIQYNTMQCNAMQCNAMQCNTIQNITKHDKTKDRLIQYCISHYFRVQLFSRFWTFAVIREWLISRFLWCCHYYK